ncbi:MAG: DUF418 domain-containing protein [Azospirillaceae bacterium]|nr:DUF418 domain-containing protein [Azospirillaceae bacterium]
MATSSGSGAGNRITVIDALRGTALVGLFLLHTIEHFDFLRGPTDPPAWLKPFDGAANDTAFFLFGGKAYGIFALMFGISFSLILDSWSRKGGNPNARFLWRLAVLAAIGWVHSLIYCGDILGILAVMGAPLVLLHRMGDRALLVLAAVLLIQPPTLWLVEGLLSGRLPPPPLPFHWSVYERLTPIYADGGLIDVVKANLWDGLLARTFFTLETGRYLQMMGLFLVGVVVGRNRVLERPDQHRRLLQGVLAGGALAFTVFYPLKRLADGAGLPMTTHIEVAGLAGAYCGLAQMAIWASGFVLLYPRLQGLAPIRALASFGRMSLTCYVSQALVFVPLFYGFGLGLYRFMGPFYSVSAGIVFVALQCALAHWWLRHYRYGPLEWLWRAATFRTLGLPLRHAPRPALADAA